jgi:hypothetical protein
MIRGLFPIYDGLIACFNSTVLIWSLILSKSILLRFVNNRDLKNFLILLGSKELIYDLYLPAITIVVYNTLDLLISCGSRYSTPSRGMAPLVDPIASP